MRDPIKTEMKINFKNVYIDFDNDRLLIATYPGSIYLTEPNEKEIRYLERITEKYTVQRPQTERNPYSAVSHDIPYFAAA